MTDHKIYAFFGMIIGLVTFFACWAYAIFQWGFLLGLGLGWLPSVFVALIAGFVGPALIALGLFALAGLYAFKLM